MKTFHCDNCGMQVFFENTVCGNCGWMLGYQPQLQAIASFSPLEPVQQVDGEVAAEAAEAVAEPGPGRWRSVRPENEGRDFKQCLNYWRENICNWMLDEREPHELCASCRLTRVIPNLEEGNNRVLWSRLETAKRRLLHSLWTLQLQPVPKMEDEEAGLAFEFMQDLPHGERVLTGHADGVITINIAEADPAYREQAREQMAEPYRTLLGHFRHESGHYYFDRLVAPTEWLAPFRELFGDERQDYGEALKTHYENGPRADWDQHFVSAYASSHPWEDWAETWAHYLHMFDTLETAYACGVQLRPRHEGEQKLVIKAPPVAAGSFDELAREWFALTYVLNSLNRSIGMPDSYPFTLTTPVLEKLRFVHEVVNGKRKAGMAAVQEQAA
ncbi:zinc-binding metallopeptidase family protein [Herbaspirillum frisingense]|uniref:zinc-binding metallopeptidase family protein n=1 Tax=Herbaspirillum frisingense TaxID=92645 RepID=UPI001F1B54B8|nr:putative zinc-binding metallopeptidase [Herbaspirillum frisingense]UIN23895.1 putative zinc-binding peptidase [Herbaspirillum frisingense]